MDAKKGGQNARTDTFGFVPAFTPLRRQSYKAVRQPKRSVKRYKMRKNVPSQ